MGTVAISVCWSLFIAVWIVAALCWRRTTHGSRRGRPLWTTSLVVAAIVLVRFTWHDARGWSDRAWWITIPGVVVLVASTIFTIWARLRLGRMWSSAPDTLQQDHELRTDGPYAVTRHPIYTGLLGMVLGTVLVSGFGSSLGFLAIAAVFLGTRIPVEERVMSKTFPDAYRRYRKRVPLLVPGLHFHRGSRC
jgi:protein-S-isoprenylcysteine O-methyltransferase Ste14